MQSDLELIKVGKVYDNGTPAVVDFDLTVARGEFIAFLGPSGCGKTTTLRMIGGFEAISAGDIRIRGQRINDLPPERRPTSMIFQSYALFPHMTVRRNISYGLEVKRVPKVERDAKVDRMLATLGLEDIADRRVNNLSGGQRQRIALARGLVVEPEILLLDEPLGALDANLRRTIQNELKILQKTLGITFVFVTHAQSEALSLSDRVVVMNQGRIEQVSTPLALYTRPATLFVAQFIGNNIIFDGAVTMTQGTNVRVKTPLGLLTGSANENFEAGRLAKIIVPTEAVQLHQANKRDEVLVRNDGNAISAVVGRSSVVGHVQRLSVDLPTGRALSLEAHVDKYPGDQFQRGGEVLLTWPAAAATVIAA
ncbi:ABC transporter ATP-binding protein [Methylocapsa sp. S129]|uniref:ABC transporter ATP-binding protein n=1 Tax=Methylocapsa sp. S129 TaxID=1641869 RepID=UPI00131B2712|nr:ABC transporter ATP-binding protein [Methylocapsa sp. S129]